MKKLNAILITVLIIGNSLLFSQPVQNDPPAAGKGDRMKTLLKLTPDQEKKFDDMRYQHQQNVIDINSKIQKTRLELKKSVEDGKIDENTILKLTDEISKLQGDIKYSSTKHWLEIYKMLNDDQKAVFSKHLARMIGSGPVREKMRAGMMMNMRRNGEGMMKRGRMMNRRGIR